MSHLKDDESTEDKIFDNDDEDFYSTVEPMSTDNSIAMPGLRLETSLHGKVGSAIAGPKHFLKQDIQLGEIAICICREESHRATPYIWIIGPHELVEEYVYYAKTEEEISNTDADSFFASISKLCRDVPSSIERLAHVLSVETEELKEMVSLAQVTISAPISGIMDYSNNRPSWIPKHLASMK